MKFRFRNSLSIITLRYTEEDLEHRLEVMLSRRAVAMAQAHSVVSIVSVPRKDFSSTPFSRLTDMSFSVLRIGASRSILIVGHLFD